MGNSALESGQRVGVTRRDGKFLGFGTYEGKHPLPLDVTGTVAEIARDAGVAVGRVCLDDGRVVWGCNCWFGPEDVVRRVVTP